jgi:transcriptional regulator with XRE-family HTH domain
MNVAELGAYIRTKRTVEKLSLRGMSALAGVSIPYLSQVERGLRRPSAEILQAIAKALRVSAETLYVKAGILEEREVADVVGAVMADPAITERQKEALVQIYRAFRDETGRAPAVEVTPGARSPRTTTGRRASSRPAANARKEV